MVCQHSEINSVYVDNKGKGNYDAYWVDGDTMHPIASYWSVRGKIIRKRNLCFTDSFAFVQILIYPYWCTPPQSKVHRYPQLLFEMVHYKSVGDKIKLGTSKSFILFSVNLQCRSSARVRIGLNKYHIILKW